MKKHKRTAFHLTILLNLILLAACLPPTASPATPQESIQWTYSDLLYLDNGSDADEVEPGHNLIALYTRNNDDVFALRLDILDIQDDTPFELYLVLDTLPGGKNTLPNNTTPDDLKILPWEILIHIPANHESASITTSDQETGHSDSFSSIQQNPDLDTLEIQLEKTILPHNPDNMRLQVLLFSSAQPNILVDTIGPIAASGFSPSPAPLLLAFWDSFPATTPAQTLRSWDGAHSGPFGSRHGLRYLLQAVEENAIPVVLLDIKNPPSLSALDYLHQLNTIRNLQQQNLLILPDYVYGDPALSAASLQLTRQISREMHIKTSQIGFGFESIPQDNQQLKAIFSALPNQNQILQNSDIRLIPLPASPYQEITLAQINQAHQNGISNDLKLELLQIAATPQTSDMVIIGGSLPASPWADASIAPNAFKYLATHPWIKTLNANDLLTMPSSKPAQGDSTTNHNLLNTPQEAVNTIPSQNAVREQLQQQINQQPQNPITTAALQTYLELTRKITNPVDMYYHTDIHKLQAYYLPQTGHLLTAANWAEAPYAANTCETDIDNDNTRECILASENAFLSFETDGGRLLFAYWLYQGEPLQWIGPSSQFAIGLSDPANWQFPAQTFSDPSEIPGAFAPPSQPFPQYQITNHENNLTFTTPDNQQKKSFTLTENGLLVNLSSADNTTTVIPLAFAPQALYDKDWQSQYTIQTIDNQLILNAAGYHLTIQTPPQTTSMQTISFLDSYPSILEPENPSQSYPAGHFLPFPLTLLNIHPTDSTSEIRLSLTP